VAEPLAWQDRKQALRRLEALSAELGDISTWLTQADEDKSAILLEDAARDIDAACWALSKPSRMRPEGWLRR
jgi:hypothetical protein